MPGTPGRAPPSIPARPPRAGYPYGVGVASHRREFPADLARAGEARHLVAWLGAAAGLRGGSLSDLAVAAEAALTDVFLSTDGGVLEVWSEVSGEELRITVGHPRVEARRMSDLEGILRQFLDDHEISSTRVVLVKGLGG
jgi:hypothetical protein